MNDFEFVREPDKSGKRKNNSLSFILLYRWLFFIAGIPLFYLTSQNSGSKIAFFATQVVGLIYNYLAGLYAGHHYTKLKRFPNFIIYFDVILLCVFSYQLGGINSDIYILFYFLLCFGESYRFLSNTLLVSIFCAIAYSFSCLFYSHANGGDFPYGRLILKDALLLFAAYSTRKITQEIKKYSEMHRKEFKLARTDKLTGLPNRHYLEQKLNDEVQYSDYSGIPLNVLMFDLDNFKKFNDTYGHTWGDKLLSLFSDIIKQNIRKSDIPIRYGGEEFIILVRESDIEMARAIGERIRRHLEKQRIYIEDDGNNRKRVTVSCGIARYPIDSSNIKEVIDFADKALYHAKEIGKNAVVCYHEIGKLYRPVQIDIDMYMKG